MSKEHIIFAQQVVSANKTTNNGKTNFHNLSFIYKTSNENMNIYQNLLTGKEQILTVISSGEQIFNSVVEGVKNIDIFDISIFSYYYFKLKVAALEAFSNLDDYCKFFYEPPTTDDIYDEMYFEIRRYLDKEVKEFWDGLFNFFDWIEINNSSLFSTEPYFLQQIILNNKHLNEEEYQNLRSFIKKVNINTYIGDINRIFTSLQNKYDFINLSSIIYYQSLDSYKRLLKKLPLKTEGEIITYLYKIDNEIITQFQELNCTFKKDSSNNSGVMIYRKK